MMFGCARWPVAPLVPDFLTGGMGGLMGTAMP